MTTKRESKLQRARDRMAAGAEKQLRELLNRGGVHFQTFIDRIDEHMAVKNQSSAELGAIVGYTNRHTRGSWWHALKHRVEKRGYAPTFRTICRLSLATGMTVKQMFEEFR